MSARRTLVLCAAGMLGLSAGAAAQGFPTTPPPATPLRPVRFPPFSETKLANGMTLLVVENHAEPELSVSLSFAAGATRDPQGKEGLADLTAQLLTKGTTTHSADQIAALIEGVGGSLSAGAGEDFLTVSTDVLSDHADVAFDLLGEVLRHATFPDSELALARTQALSSLRLELSQPGIIAGRFFRKAIYGDDPYGRSPTEASYRAITRDDVVRFASTYLRPEGALLVMAGDITPAAARRRAARAFGDWRGTPPGAAPAVTPPAKAATDILLVNRPGSVQANIVVGNATFGPTDPGYYAARVATQVLGGGADSRLFLILREQHGWTYGSYASLDRQKGLGYWEATFEGRTAVADSALREMLHQIDLLRTTAIPDTELANAKGFLVGSFPLTIETPGQVAGAVANARLLGLGDDYVRLYRERLAAVTAAQAEAAAARTYRRDALTIVVVGDADALYARLDSIAPVHLVDLEGRPMTLADLHPKAVPLALDPKAIVARRDSFALVVNGTAAGALTAEWRTGGDSLVYVERTTIPMAGLDQTSTVVMDAATLAMRRSDQTGTAPGGLKPEIHLTYANGRVHGTSSTVQPDRTIKTTTIDTTVTAGTVDDNALNGLLALVPPDSGKLFSLPVLTSGDGVPREFTLKVVGTESVTVPAGTFRATRIDVSGAQQPLTVYVTTDPPRRLVKIAVQGSPVTIELAR